MKTLSIAVLALTLTACASETTESTPPVYTDPCSADYTTSVDTGNTEYVFTNNTCNGLTAYLVPTNDIHSGVIATYGSYEVTPRTEDYVTIASMQSDRIHEDVYTVIRGLDSIEVVTTTYASWEVVVDSVTTQLTSTDEGFDAIYHMAFSHVADFNKVN